MASTSCGYRFLNVFVFKVGGLGIFVQGTVPGALEETKVKEVRVPTLMGL